MFTATRFMIIFLYILFYPANVFTQPEMSLLEVGKPIERELKGAEAHTYNLKLEAGQFLHALADQRGIDVIVTLFAPDGKKMLEVDSPNGTRGIEPLWLLSEMSGVYRLEIRSLETDSPVGKYEVKIVELRTALPTDKFFIAASKNMLDANFLKRQDSADSIAEAIEKYKEAADLFQQIGDRKKQADALAKIGEIYQLNNKPDLAIKFYEQALDIYKSVNSKRDIALILAWLGEVHNDLGDYLKALSYFQTALPIAGSLNDQRLTGAIGINMGVAQEELGNFDEALKSYFRSLEIAEAVNSPGATAAALNNIGVVYTDQGNYARALEFQEKQLALVMSSGRENLIPRTLLNIGSIHKEQGNSLIALDYYERALSGSEKLKDKKLTSFALNNIGIIYLKRGEYEKALDYFNKSVQITNEFGNSDSAGFANIGLVYEGQGKNDKALEYFQKSLDISKGTDVNSMLYLANRYALDGDYSKSLDFALRTIQLARPRGLQSILTNAYTAAGKANILLGKTKEAQQNLNEAILIKESLRLQIVGGVSEQTQFFEQYSSPYYLVVELLVSQNKSNEAFTFAEQSKARALLDVLQNGKADINKVMTVQEREQERKLKNEIVSLNAQISIENEQNQPDKTRLTDLQSQLNKKRLEFEDFQTRLYAVHPELKIQRGEMKPVSLAESANLLPDNKTVLLEYVVADNKAFLFVLTKDISQKVSLKVYPIEIKQKDLAQKTESFRAKLAKGDLDFARQAQDLYNLLLKPAEAQLKNKNNLIVVPDNVLWDLPFQTLQTANNKYLIETAAISYAPSLTALREMAKKNKGKKFSEATLLAFGNPTVGKETSDRIKQVFMSESLEPLPEAERLVNGLGRLYGANRSKILIGAEAREETAKTETPKYRIVQFAAHGILNDVSPMYSHIVLAQKQDNPNEDGLLEAWEMKDLDLNADLVILSACETARGKLSSGEGVIGMSWALFIAGAPTTVASQWKVESSSTTELMLEFHRQLLTGKGISKAEALRRASLKLMKMPNYKHPSYWAGFVMVGDGF